MCTQLQYCGLSNCPNIFGIITNIIDKEAQKSLQRYYANMKAIYKFKHPNCKGYNSTM